jgi:hypothetical protein
MGRRKAIGAFNLYLLAARLRKPDPPVKHLRHDGEPIKTALFHEHDFLPQPRGAARCAFAAGGGLLASG